MRGVLSRVLQAPAVAGAFAVAGIVAVMTTAAAQEENRVYADCEIDGRVLAPLAQAIRENSNIFVTRQSINFVVVYSLALPNNGQAFFDGEGGEGEVESEEFVPPKFTGPVICTNRAFGFLSGRTDIEPTTEDARIPPGEGQVDLLGLNEALVLQYQQSRREVRFCHTAKAGVDCFNLSFTFDLPSEGGPTSEESGE